MTITNCEDGRTPCYEAGSWKPGARRVGDPTTLTPFPWNHWVPGAKQVLDKPVRFHRRLIWGHKNEVSEMERPLGKPALQSTGRKGWGLGPPSHPDSSILSKLSGL